jgi:glycosyltransferase involved in cell wall biosynthesis
MQREQKIWFLSEVYCPDEQGTAFYTTGLAEGLASHFKVRVLCNYPTVTARGSRVPRREERNGVLVERCTGTTFSKDVFFLRLINIATYSATLLFKALAGIRKGDIVIAVTSPPSAPFIAKLVSIVRRAICIVRLEDVYPEILVATGMLPRTSPVNGLLESLNRWLFRSVDGITVLGRDMKALAEKKTGAHNGHIRVIRSWADVDIVFPLPRESNRLLQETGLAGKFVVSLIGNIGRAQAIELILDAITLLKENDRIHFLFVGSGARKIWLEEEARLRGLRNITILGQRPRGEQTIFLNACDISIVSLLPGMTGAGVPSRMYNIMAAGKPVIAVTGRDSETALIVQEENIGWVVQPAHAEDVVRAVLDAQSDPAKLNMMGQRAVSAARERFSREKVIEEYLHFIRSTHRQHCYGGGQSS